MDAVTLTEIPWQGRQKVHLDVRLLQRRELAEGLGQRRQRVSIDVQLLTAQCGVSLTNSGCVFKNCPKLGNLPVVTDAVTACGLTARCAAARPVRNDVGRKVSKMLDCNKDDAHQRRDLSGVLRQAAQLKVVEVQYPKPRVARALRQAPQSCRPGGNWSSASGSLNAAAADPAGIGPPLAGRTLLLQ
jgi:hypothetical protein